jgi:hypothetical protein
VSVGTARPSGAPPARASRPPTPRQRVLVVYTEGRPGEVALREGAELVAAGAELTVVTLVPQAKPLKCCKGGGAGPYNCAVRDQAEDEIAQAKKQLGTLAPRVSFTKLAGIPWPPLGEWAAARSFDLVIVPKHRFDRAGGRLARELRAATTAEIRSPAGR